MMSGLAVPDDARGDPLLPTARSMRNWKQHYFAVADGGTEFHGSGSFLAISAGGKGTAVGGTGDDSRSSERF